MKKILNLFLMAITIFALASCVDGNSTTNSFEITSYPKTTYILNEEFSWEGLEIKVNEALYQYGSSTNPIPSDTVTLPDVTDMSAGTHTVKLTCSNGLSASFQYTVLNKQFANGDGTAASPYQISTVEQFYVALKNETETKTYYTLVNDIDFNKKIDGRGEVVTKNVEINGQGYSLRNVNGALGYKLVDSTIKNIDIHFVLDDSNEFNYRKRGAIYDYLLGTNTFENINTYGTIRFSDSNASIFGILGSEETADITITNKGILKSCNNYANITNVGSYSAIFTSGSDDKNGCNRSDNVWYVLNCKNYGTLIARQAALLCPNQNKLAKCIYVVDTNTINYGKLYSIGSESKDVCQLEELSNSTGNATNILCAYIGNSSVKKVASHFFMYDASAFYANGEYVSGQTITSSAGEDNIPDKNTVSSFKINETYAKYSLELTDFNNMNKVNMGTKDNLSYNFVISKKDGKLVFTCTNTEVSIENLTFVVAFTGVSTKHTASGEKLPRSNNSVFATISASNLYELNELKLIDSTTDVKNVITWSSVDWNDTWTSGNGQYTYTNFGDSTGGANEVAGSNGLYMTNESYVVKPCEANKYATAYKVSWITITAFDENGNACGGYSVEWNSITESK